MYLSRQWQDTQDELGAYYSVKKQKDTKMNNQKYKKKKKTGKIISEVCQRETEVN